MTEREFPFEEGQQIMWRHTPTTIVEIKGWSRDGEYVECTVSQVDAVYRRFERSAAIRPEDVWA